MKGKHLPRFTDHIEEEGKMLHTRSTALQRRGCFYSAHHPRFLIPPSSEMWPLRCAGAGGLRGGAARVAARGTGPRGLRATGTRGQAAAAGPDPGCGQAMLRVGAGCGP